MSDILRSIFLFLGWFTPLFRYEKEVVENVEVVSVFAYQEYQERFIHMLRKTWSLYVHEMKDSCHYAIMYSIQHTTSHHAYDIYTSTCMLACKKKLKCQHFSANCPDVLNVGSVPSTGWRQKYLGTMAGTTVLCTQYPAGVTIDLVPICSIIIPGPM